MAESDDRVRSVVAGRRLASGAGPKRSFTIERSEARMRLRGRPGNRPWTWTLALLRAGLVLAHDPAITVSWTREGELDVWAFDLMLPGADLGELDVAAWLDASVEPDPGPGSEVALRARRLLARALNEALAAEPAWAEVITPYGGRRCERRATSGPRDPYDERAVPTRAEPHRLRMRIALPPRGLGRVLDALRQGTTEVLATLRMLWASAIPWAAEAVRPGEGFAVRQPLPGAAVELGLFARWWPLPGQAEVALVRDGLRVAQLDAALAGAGLPSALLRGYIECDRLLLTVDEGTVVDGAALVELVAWLSDALAHSEPDASGAPQVRWPDAPELRTASGATITVAQVEQLADKGREVMFAWAHEVDRVPASLRARALALWPSAHAWLHARLPALSLVPVRGVLAAQQVARTDFTSLAQGSLPALSLAVDSWVRPGAPPLAVEVVALVHSHGIAARGAVVVLAWERSLGRLDDDAIVVPGVTLVARIADAERVDALRSDSEGLGALAGHVAASVRLQMASLVRHAIAHGGAEAVHRVPFLRHAIQSLSARSLELRLVARAGALVELRWRDDPLLDLVVAHTRAQAPMTLRALLERARDVGGIVLGESARRWFTLEDEEPAHATWIPTVHGAELLPRLFGRAALWQMPIVPQSMVHVAPATAQRQLLLDPQEVGRLLLRTSTDPSARNRLLGHLLVARATGESEQGLADVPLLSTYDPRAVEPARLRSLSAVIADGRRFAVVPSETGSRELAGPVIEATPGEAALLVEVVGLSTTPTPDGAPRASAATRTSAPQQRPAGMREPVLSVAIADPLAVGALHLHAEPGAGGIEIWAKGLRVGALALPTPLAEVEGKLWLSDAGIRARHEGLEAIAGREGRALVATALRQLALAPPGSQRRRALERFIGHCRAALVEDRDRFGLRALLSSGDPPPPVLGPQHAVATRLPSLRRLWLLGLVRHALGRTTSIETAWLSWRAARLVDPRASTWTVELGSRHRWNRRALSEDATIVDVVLAAYVAVADVLAQTESPPGALATALLRVLATAHTGPRT